MFWNIINSDLFPVDSKNENIFVFSQRSFKIDLFTGYKKDDRKVNSVYFTSLLPL